MEAGCSTAGVAVLTQALSAELVLPQLDCSLLLRVKLPSTLDSRLHC